MASRESTPAPEPNAAEAAEPAKATRSLRRGLISVAILILLAAGLILAVPGLHGVGHTVAHMQVGWIAVALSLEVLSCMGYVLAFLQVFERSPFRFGSRVALSEQAFGAAVSLGGAGSVGVGAWLMIERGARPARVAERSAVLFLVTSAVGVITLALTGIALFARILPGPRSPLLSLLPGTVGVFVIALFLALPRMSERAAGHRTPGRIQRSLTTTAESVRDTRDLLIKPNWRIVGAFAYLWCDIAVLAACFAASGHSPPLTAIVLAYQIGALSNLVPVPGGIGVLDGSLVGMLVLYGVAATPATSATLVYHAISLLIPTAWGTFAFLRLRYKKDEAVALRPPLAERQRLRAKGHQ